MDKKDMKYEDSTEMRIIAENMDGYKIVLAQVFNDGDFMIPSVIIVKGKLFQEISRDFKVHIEFLIEDKWIRLW